MKSFTLGSILLAAGANALVARDGTCCFGITASGPAANGTVDQLTDGQNRVAGTDLSAGTYCIDTNGAITDGEGRGCIITPETSQFQCDLNKSPVSGFSVGSSGLLSFNSSSSWYICETGGNGENIYVHTSADVTMCTPTTLTADNCKNVASSCGASSSASEASSVAPASAATASTVAPASSAPAATASTVAPASSVAETSSTASAASVAPASTLVAGTSEVVTSSVAATASAKTSSAVVATSSTPAASVATSSAEETSPAVVATSSTPAASVATSSAAPATTETSTTPSTVSATSTATATHTVASASTSSVPATSSPASTASTWSTSAVVTSSSSIASSSAVVTSALYTNSSSVATSTASSTGSSSSCAATTLTTGSYQYPHLIVPVSSASPETAYGTEYYGYVNSTYSTLFNFDIPADYSGKTCNLVFLFPLKSELETTDYTFSGNGAIDFKQLSSVATESTTYDSVPSTETDFGTTTIAEGNSYVISTFSCPSGTTVSYEMSEAGTTDLWWFNDWNPSPLGLFITTC